MQSNAKQIWKGVTCKTMQSSAKQCKAMQSNAQQCKAMQSDAKHCKAMQSNAKQCNALQSNAKQCKLINAKQCKAVQSKAMQSVAKQCKAKQSNTKQCIAQQCKAIQSKCGFGVEEPGSGASRNPGGGPVPQGTRGALIIYISVTGPVAGTCSLHGMKFVFFGGVWGCVSMDCGLRCVVFSGVLAGMWIVDCGFFWGLGWNVDCGLWFFLGSWLDCGLWIVVFSGVLVWAVAPRPVQRSRLECGLWIVVFSGVLVGMWIVDCGFFWGLGWNDLPIYPSIYLSGCGKYVNRC
jgi:hypothetical protein